MNPVTLWIAMLGGPMVWLIYLQVSYALVPSACLAQNKIALVIALIAALIVTVAIALVAWRSWREVGADAIAEDTRVIDRSRFMALSGLGIAALSVLLVLASAIPIIILGACD